MGEPDTSWVPEADLAEQQTSAAPEVDEATTLPGSPTLVNADEADVLEQATVLTLLDEDDYRDAESADIRSQFDRHP